MYKQVFLDKLRRGLSGLPQEDIEEHLIFYGEMLDDSIEEGLSEEEAVSELGDIDEIIKQALSDVPLAEIAEERVKSKHGWKYSQPSNAVYETNNHVITEAFSNISVKTDLCVSQVTLRSLTDE